MRRVKVINLLHIKHKLSEKLVYDNKFSIHDDFLQQKKRPPIFTNQRAHDVTLIFFIKLTLLLP